MLSAIGNSFCTEALFIFLLRVFHLNSRKRTARKCHRKLHRLVSDLIRCRLTTRQRPLAGPPFRSLVWYPSLCFDPYLDLAQMSHVPGNLIQTTARRALATRVPVCLSRSYLAERSIHLRKREFHPFSSPLVGQNRALPGWSVTFWEVPVFWRLPREGE